MTPEQKLDREVGQIIKKTSGAFSVRIESSHTAPGFPDRIIFANGRIILLELKAGSPLTKAQIVFHRTLSNLNVPIYTLKKQQNNVIMNDVKYASVSEALGKLLED